MVAIGAPLFVGSGPGASAPSPQLPDGSRGARWSFLHAGSGAGARPLPWGKAEPFVNFEGDVKVRYPPNSASQPPDLAAVRPGRDSRALVGRRDSSDERKTTVADAVKVNPEQRMLIDGKLVEADSGKTFDNVNPATEEVLGSVADASAAEMGRAIDAARRAFDETDWSTNKGLRKRCLEQLHEALQAEQEELREQLILEVGCPRMTTHGPQLDAPLSEALAWPAKEIDNFEWETVLPDAMGITGAVDSRRIWREPVGVVGAIVPWNFPVEVTLHKLGQALATGTPSSSSRRRTRRGTPPSSAASSRRRPTSRPASS